MLSKDHLLLTEIAGDAKAFEGLFKLYYTRLTLFANRFVNNVPVAEEIVSDVFAMIWEKADTITLTTSLSAYLFKTVQNRCFNYLKHQKVENLYVNYLERHNLVDEVVNNAEARYLEKETAAQIKQALENLPDKCREIFVMSRFDHLKYKEIADKLEISPKTVERQISIALQKLRMLLKHVTYMLF